MSKTYAFLICFVTLHSMIFANDCNESIDQPEPIQAVECCAVPCLTANPCEFGNDTEIRVGYFYPSSKRFREIFKGARLDYEIETAQSVHRNIAIWANVSWFPKSGHSIGGHDRTTVNLVPISLGLKFVHWFNCYTRLRFGAGASYFFLITSDHGCPCKSKHANHQNFGGAFKWDLSFFLICGLYTSVFFDYLYLPVTTSKGIDQAGGFKTGLGLGYHF